MSEEINHIAGFFLGAAAMTVAAAQLGVTALANAHSRTKNSSQHAAFKIGTCGHERQVIPIHGAWAGGSSWAHVITSLQSKGLKTLQLRSR